jgi:UDP-N-acetylglucosamine 2-epimerase (non-hydrolysing)
LHRPANVEEEGKLRDLLQAIISHSKDALLIFSVYPRTKQIIERLQILHPRLFTTDPLSYLEFNYLVENRLAVIRDSGGITEETTVMGIPCITLRDNTERPETVTLGTNELIGTNPNAIEPTLKLLFSGNWKKGIIPDKWDGKLRKG